MSSSGPNSVQGGSGGFGIQGIFTSDITPPFSQPYAVGAGGSAGQTGPGNQGNDGGAGGATSIANLFSLNGGNAGTNGGENQNGQNANPGSVGSGSFLKTFNSNAAFQLNNNVANTFRFGISAAYGAGGGGGTRNSSGMQQVAAGGKGVLYVFDNS